MSSGLSALIRRYRTQLGDSVYSVAGLVLMNAVCQVAVYPFLARRLGESGYGNVQYLLAYINIFAVSVGSAANLARMTAPAEERMREGGDYNLFLLLVSLLGLPLTALVRAWGGVEMDFTTAACYYLLFVAMTFRYYADVAYKLTLRYRGYFCYYLTVSVGYGLGVFLFYRTGIWPLALLPGELFGVLYAYFGNPTLRRRLLRPSPALRRVWGAILVLVLSEGIGNLIANADRLLLKFLIDASAVTVYYLATLVGKTMSLISAPLSGVLIGYLARYEGGLSRRLMAFLALGSAAAVLLFTGVCVGGSYLVLLLLYPAELEAVRPYLLVGSLSQVIFFTTGVLLIFLIRFAKKRCQVYVNGVFGLCFFGFGIPATLRYGLPGFAFAMIAANAMRWAAALFFGFRAAGGAKPAAA